jgi:hypothetical protein
MPAGPMTVPENRWVKVAGVPADPLGRELEPGRGAFWCFEPASGAFLRYGGYTPTECNALWRFDLASRAWRNALKVDYSWPPPGDRPGAGAWWCMAYDTRRKVVWLCGGVGLAARTHPELFEDIWQYDPAKQAFAPMKSKGFPRYGARIVYDSKNDLLIRAPAYDGEWGARHNKETTWVYAPAKNAWEGRKTPGSPRHALAGAFVFAADAGKAVYLAAERDHTSSTWTYDAAANHWERLACRENPPPRVAAGAAYDTHNKLVVLHGGVGASPKGYSYLHRGGGTQLHDTWALDMAKAEWRKLDVGASLIPKLPGQQGRRFELVMAMDYDSRNKAMMLSAPTVGVWALRLRPEGAAALPELSLGALPPAEETQPRSEPVFQQAPPNRKLLELEEGKWVRLGGGPVVGGGEVPMVYDEATGFCLKYGGCNDGGGPTFNSGYGNCLVAYDPAAERWLALRWTDPCGPPRPNNGCTRFYAYDPGRKVTWFAAGTAGNYLAYSFPPDAPASGTWRYDGLRDRFGLVPTTGRQPSHGTICCYDRANGLFVTVPKEAWACPHVCVFDPGKGAWLKGAAEKGYEYTYGCYVDSLKSLLVVKRLKDGPAKTLAYDAAAAAWRDMAPSGECPHGPGRPTPAYDPINDIVLCVSAGKTYVYVVSENAWKLVDTNTPPKVNEMMVFDRRHSVFLATAAMGVHMWAYRHKRRQGGSAAASP